LAAIIFRRYPFIFLVAFESSGASASPSFSIPDLLLSFFGEGERLTNLSIENALLCCGQKKKIKLRGVPGNDKFEEFLELSALIACHVEVCDEVVLITLILSERARTAIYSLHLLLVLNDD
jgi:hypothetical protein